MVTDFLYNLKSDKWQYTIKLSHSKTEIKKKKSFKTHEGAWVQVLGGDILFSD